MKTQERRSENLTAKQLADQDKLTIELIGAKVLIVKGEQTVCGTVQRFWANDMPIFEKFTDREPSGIKTSMILFLEGEGEMAFESTDDDVNIEILYPAN